MYSETGIVGRYIHVDSRPEAQVPFSIADAKAGTSAKEALNAINTIAMRLRAPSTLQDTSILTSCKGMAAQIYQGYDAKYQQLNVIQKFFVWLFGSRSDIFASYNAISNIPPEGEARGEYKEKDDGNCAFLTLARKTAFNGSLLVEQRALDAAALTLREEAVAWIRDNFGRDEGLPSRLSQSLYEHYTAKANHIIEQIGPYDTGELERAIAASFNTLAGEALDSSKLEGMLEDYLTEMVQPGIFGGAAELYAVGKMHNLYIKIHGAASEVFAKSDFTDHDGHGEVHMYLRGNHYNSYYPH